MKSKRKLVYFECEVEGHESNLLNSVCIDTSCKQRTLLCLFCQYHSHQHHEVRPLRIFLDEFEAKHQQFESKEASASEKEEKNILQSYEDLSTCIEGFQQLVDEQFSKFREEISHEVQQRRLNFESNSHNQAKQFQTALSTILENECVSSSEQIQCVQTLLSKVNMASPQEEMAIEFKGKKQIQINKENQYRLTEIEQSKHRIALCMSRITDELSVIKKQLSSVFSASPLADVIPPSAALNLPKQIESTRSVIKAVPPSRAQKLEGKKQMEKMFLNHNNSNNNNNNNNSKKSGNSSDNEMTPESDDAFQNSLEDFFSSQWVKSSSTSIDERKGGKAKKGSEEKSIVASAANSFLNFERPFLTAKNPKSGQASPLPKVVEPSEPKPLLMNNLIEESRSSKALSSHSDDFSDFKHFQHISEDNQHFMRQIEDENAKTSRPSLVGKTDKQQSYFSSSIPRSFSSQEINLDIKVGVKFKAHSGITKDVIFLDEQRLATCSYDRMVKVWDISSKKLLATLSGHEGRVMQLKYSAKHKLIGSVGKDKLALFWNDHSYTQHLRIAGHKESVMTLEFVDSHDVVLTGSSDKFIKIWCVQTGKQLFKIENTADSVLQFTFEPANSLLMVAGHKIVTLYSFSDGSISNNNENNNNNNKNKKDESSSSGLVSLNLIGQFNAHNESINMIQMLNMREKQYFLTCSDDKTLKLWDYFTLELIQTINEDTMISGFSYLKKLGILVVAMWGYHGGGRTSFYDISDFTKIQDVESVNRGTTSIKINNEENQLVSAHENGEIQLFYLNY